MKQKVAILHVRDSSGIFGAERVILALGRKIDSKKFDFKLLCMRRQDGRSNKLICKAKEQGIFLLTVDVDDRINIRAIKNIRSLLKEHGISIVHSHDFKSNFYTLVASIGLKIVRVTTAHGSTRDSFLKRLYLLFDECFIYRFYDKVIAVSTNLRNHLKNFYLGNGKTLVIQNGIDIEQMQKELENTDSEPPLTTPPNHKIFGVIGRLYPDKGHRFFLMAFANVIRKFEKAIGLIIGDGPIRDDILNQTIELGLEESIIFCGVRNNINEVYSKIDFLVIPSLREGLPYVLLEAMAKKIPVLATSVGDIPLLIKERETGFLVPPGETVALEMCMMDMIKDPDNAKRMAGTGFELIINKFSAERMVRETEQLYNSLVSCHVRGENR